MSYRDYSVHTEGIPVQILLFEERFKVRSPSGLCGRLQIDQLGKIQLDIRNPVLTAAKEVLRKAENHYSGILTMRWDLAQAGMAESEFREEQGTFVVCFRKAAETSTTEPNTVHRGHCIVEKLLQFCAVPRTHQEIANFLNIKSVPHTIKSHIRPLVEQGLITLSLPEKPKTAVHRREKNKSYKEGRVTCGLLCLFNKTRRNCSYERESISAQIHIKHGNP